MSDFDNEAVRVGSRVRSKHDIVLINQMFEMLYLKIKTREYTPTSSISRPASLSMLSTSIIIMYKILHSNYNDILLQANNLQETRLY